MKAMIRAIKIDVVKKEIYEVEITTNIKTIYKHMEAGCFAQVGGRMKNGDILLVDDNGLLRADPIGWFNFGEYPQTLEGHGIMIGTDRSGETVDVKSDLSWVKERVDFQPTITRIP